MQNGMSALTSCDYLYSIFRFEGFEGEESSEPCMEEHVAGFIEKAVFEGLELGGGDNDGHDNIDRR
jgi:hypothetical protein